MWEAYWMPWIPELFSEPVLERLREKWERERLEAVPYYDGLMAGERDALIRSRSSGGRCFTTRKPDIGQLLRLTRGHALQINAPTALPAVKSDAAAE
jgi:hypothetical protein